MSEPQPVPVVTPPGRFVRLAGRGLTYVRDVAGPPGAPVVVLLHGLAATTAMNWPGAFTVLSRQFRVVALDHRGHGRGIRSSRRFRLADCADDVVALADELEIERFIAVGYSMGGPVALLARRRHADRVSGLVLCATSALFADGDEPAPPSPLGTYVAVSLRATPPLVRRRVAQSMLLAIGADSGLPPAFLAEARRHDPAAIVEAGRAVRRFDGRGWVDGLGCPAASVITERDGLVPPERQLALARALGATVHRVAGGHEVAVTDPRRFLPVLSEACVSVARRAAMEAAG